MRISRVHVSNFRGLRDLAIPMSTFGCIIGENNAGKSSVLQALEVFFNGPSLKGSDFFNPERSVRVEVAFEEIKGEDLARLAEEHRGRIENAMQGGRIVLSRTYEAPGKGVLKQVDDIPKDLRFRSDSLAELVAKKSGPELKEAALFTFPELAGILSAKPTQKEIKQAVSELAAELPASERVSGDIDLVTGMESSIRALLPEVIYIPAVKELSDDLKTTESASFGKLLAILFDQINHQLSDVDALFGKLRSYLNVETLPDGTAVDGRLAEVKEIEGLVQGNLQAAFPDTEVSIEIPPPDLRSVLSNASISIDDGVRGTFKSKGDGLRRSVTFAILRSYAELRSKARATQAGTAPRPYLLLFEEPELFLHPRAQHQLFDALRIFAQDNHVLVSTHSTAFYSPQATGTFIKIAKDRTTSPPSSKAYPVDLSHFKAKDQFQMIRQENNDAAFFSDRVLLVEGDSDHILIPHIARVLNDDWDFGKRSVAIARVNGKASIERYRNFFEGFGVAVSVLVDLDALAEGFGKLGASPGAVEKHHALMMRVGESVAADAGEAQDLSNNQLRKVRESPSMKELWGDAKRFGDLFAAGDCEWSELRSRVEDFFFRAVTRDPRVLAVKESPTEEIRRAKEVLITHLRGEGIYVLERGSIEDYYPSSMAGDKLTGAQKFCDEYSTAQPMRELWARADDVEECEFDLIFRSFFEA